MTVGDPRSGTGAGSPDGLVIGLHERVLERRLQELIDHRADARAVIEAVDEADAPHVLSRHVAGHLASALADAEEDDRVDLVNRILRLLPENPDVVLDGPHQLLSFYPSDAETPSRPTTPLSDVALLTNSPRDPQLGTELKRELASADRVDLLCPFVKWSGIRLLERELAQLRDRGVPLRILTTTYIGATDRKALDRLADEYGAEIRINYETRSTRLHAKAWLFYRETGFDTGYVGSSNLSRAALVDGLEWNVRISRSATPSLVEKFTATFDSYWNAPEFAPYDPQRDATRLDAALREARGGPAGAAAGTSAGDIDTTLLDVRPYPHQQIMLNDLAAERETHDRHRNLLVAATGTGKTVIAALDYARLAGADRRGRGSRPSLLFVVHRAEILKQALHTYRDVLKDGSFGELFVDGHRPTDGTHIFASIQSIGRSAQLQQWARDHFDIIVIDEFHHAEAPSYRRLLDWFEPRELLGLTATPERTDGVDVAAEFFSGRTASELRLWDALEADLLVPFHYFGIADNTDLSSITFQRGSYDTTELSKLYTGNDARTRMIIAALTDTVVDVSTIRALGFCVSIAHAVYMARKFTEVGIVSYAITSETSRADRAELLNRFRAGEIRCLFTVDIFNEGVDIPAVDTVLMLRPTQSATIFLQQLGRGLRRAPDKSVLTVLDFVGHQNAQFRFDLKLRALTGASRRRLQRDVQQGFPFLPAGSQNVLDKVAEEEILSSLKSTLNLSTRDLVRDVANHKPADTSAAEYSLAAYLHEADRGLADIYGGSGPRAFGGQQRARSWSALKDWSFPQARLALGDDEVALLSRMRAFTHIDDNERIDRYRELLDGTLPSDDALAADPYAAMLFYQLRPTAPAGEIADTIRRVRRMPAIASELRDLLEVCEQQARTLPQPLAGLERVPVRSHSRYTREELLAGFGLGTTQQGIAPGNMREGVKWIPAAQTDVLLVTLKKSESDYSPTTLYRDYAISETLFHWESQNATSPESPTGQRYIHHRQQGSHVVLFVRAAKEGDLGTEPYICLGTVDYVQHSGSRPMQIEWKLERAMPAEMLVAARAVA